MLLQPRPAVSPKPPKNVTPKTIQADPNLAWIYHCNIAVTVQTLTGTSHGRAHDTAARLMDMLYEVDTKALSQWKELFPPETYYTTKATNGEPDHVFKPAPHRTGPIQGPQ